MRGIDFLMGAVCSLLAFMGFMLVFAGAVALVKGL